MKILWIDTETTGLIPGTHGIVQIAGIVEIDKKIECEFEFKMNSGNVVYDPQALLVNKRTEDEIKTWTNSAQVLRDFEGLLSQYIDKYNKNDKFIPAGYNVKFDCDMLRAWIGKWYGSWFDYHVLDVMAVGFVERYKGRLNVDNHKLVTLCNNYGIELDAHDALNDIRATRELFLKITEEGKI